MEISKGFVDFFRKPIDEAVDYVNALVDVVPNSLKRSVQDKIVLVKKGVLHTECIESHHKDIEWEFVPHTSLDVNGNFAFTVELNVYYEFVEGRSGTKGCPGQIATGKVQWNPSELTQRARAKGFSARQLVLFANDLRCSASQYAAECFDIVIKIIELSFGSDYRALFVKAFFMALEARKTAHLKKELKVIARDLYTTRGFAKSETIAGIRERIENLASS